MHSSFCLAGSPHVASLKTRLLALQVLGTIMNELSDTSPEATEKCAKVCMVGGGTLISRVLSVGYLMSRQSSCIYACPLCIGQDTMYHGHIFIIKIAAIETNEACI